jgi:hypothetical protein
MRHTLTRALTALAVFSTAALAAPDRATVYSESPEALREAYMKAIESTSAEAVWALFCPTNTAKRMRDLYQRTVDSTIGLPLESITLAPLPPKKDTMPHSVEPLGRLVFAFDTSRQTGDVRMASSFLLYGKTEGGYCLAIPEVRGGS